MQNVSISNGMPCSGCGGCVAVCPKDAIRLKLDEKGFYRAVIQEEYCVNCGLCQKVCHRFTPQKQGISLYDAKLYALQSADESTVRKCSSGGIAHELAVHTIINGGIAAGAVYNLTDNTVHHELVSEVDQISRLDGSKYLQSNPEQAFRTVLENAKKRPCTVFGTPCQIAALAAAADLRNVRDRFLLVEIFCHGVPTDLLWQETLKKVQKKTGNNTVW